jgi:hypothetical protein
MAVSKQEVVMTFTAETKEVTKQLDNVAKSTEDIAKGADKASKSIESTGDATGALTGQLDKLTGGAVSGFAAMRTGILNTVKGMKSLKLAIAATGLGALVIAVASLATAFTSSREGAEKFRRILGVIGSVTDNLLDLVADLGEKIIYAFENPVETIKDFAQAILDNVVNRFVGLAEFVPQVAKAIGQAFSGDFAEAGKTAADAVAKVAFGVQDYTDKATAAIQASKDFANQIVEEGKKAAEIADQRNRALVLERELVTERAELESEIALLRLKSRQEEEFSAEQRGQFLRNAQALEDQLLDKELEVLTLRRDAQVEENKLARSSEENLNKEAQAIANVSRLQAARLNQQRQTQRELNRINKEIARDAKAAEAQEAALQKEEEKRQAAQVAARQKLEEELYALGLSAREKEEYALLQAYDKRIAIAGDDEGLLRAATERLQADLAAIEQKYLDQESKAKDQAAAKDQARRDKEREEELATAEAISAARLSVAKQTLGALAALNDAFAGESEVEQKKAFERSKKIQSAQALISTYESAVQAFKSLAGIPVVGPALGTAASVAAIASGLAQVKSIQSQTLGGGATAAAPAPAPALSAAATEATQAPSAPTLDLSFLGDIATTPQPQQAYVISENVTNAQQANLKIQQQATL